MKKNYFIGLWFLLFLCFGFKDTFAASNIEEGVKSLAEQISKNMKEKQKQKIAIIDFSDLNGNVTALGQFIAEELTTQLFITAPGNFEVVERRQLLKLEEELALGQMGFIEEKGIKKMGQVLGVDAIVTGSMTDLGNTVKINARMIAVESAKVFAVAATDIPKTVMVFDLMAKQVEERQPEVKAPSALTVQSGKEEAKRKEETTFFKNDLFKITVKSLKKTGNTIELALLYENIVKKNIKVSLKSAYLSDENGERWELKELHGIERSSFFPITDFPQNLPALVKLIFSAEDGSPNGTAFTAAIDHLSDAQHFQAVIRNIPITE